VTTQPATQQARQLITRAGRVAQRKVREFADNQQARSEGSARAAQGAPQRSSVPAGATRLAPTTALRENGFYVFSELFSPAECADLERKLKSEAGIEGAQKYTKVDVANTFQGARDILFEGRILDAVQSALGEQPRFLQVGDLHYLHDTAGWHRDSVHRAFDSSQAPDWRESQVPFGVVKAILYMESDNAAMGMMAGSHLTPIEMDHAHVKSVEEAGGQLVIDAGQDPNIRLSDEQKRVPLAWRARVGDVLVFDERMYHCGRRIDNGVVTKNREAGKFTLSLVFGRDNQHSQRMYSYFRYVRQELPYRDFAPAVAAELAERDLVLSAGWGNYYREQPDDLRHVYLPDPARLPSLIEEFSTPVV
jgi:ectoine hydroxylase-related dioxygenase (phytanoyl-CoA dioxygenase family)